MAEWFLEDQLKRMKEMSEQMSRASDRAAELSHELERDRESRHDPLNNVRDFRTYAPQNKSKERSDDKGGHTRRRPARESSRRRR